MRKITCFTLLALALCPWLPAHGAAPPPMPAPFRIEPESAVEAVAVSPDGRTLAVGFDGVGLWDLTRRKFISYVEVVGGDKHAYSGCQPPLYFSPDGKTLVFPKYRPVLPPGKRRQPHDPCALHVVDVARRKPRRAIDLPPDIGLSGVVLADDRTIALCGLKDVAVLIDLETGKVTGRLKGEEKMPGDFTDEEVEGLKRKPLKDALAFTEHWTARMALSPDGKLLAVSTHGGWLSLWDLARRKRLWHRQDGEGPHHGLSFSHDSETLATIADGSHSVRFWRRKGNLRFEVGTRLPRKHALFLPDDTLILEETLVYDPLALSGSPPVGHSRFGFIRWDPVEARVWGRMWDRPSVPEPSDVRVRPPHSFHLSANGHTLAVVSPDHRGIDVYDLRTFWPRPDAAAPRK